MPETSASAPPAAGALSPRLRVLAAAALFSCGGAAVKAVHLTAWQVASFRSSIATLVFLLLLPEARRRPTPRVLGIGAIYASTMILFVQANKLTTAASSSRLSASRAAGERTQLLVTTHSPFFLNALRPEEVRVLWRDEQGYTQTRRAADLPGVPAFIEHGALLGHLWMEGQLGVGDPLVNQGAPTRPFGGRRSWSSIETMTTARV